MSDSIGKKRKRTAAAWHISPDRFPRHIAIIMDGNGRWARSKNLPRFHGHSEGAKTAEKIVKYCVDIGLECLSLYSFSAQNWKRPRQEVDFLMHLYARYLADMRPLFMRNNVKLVHLGRAHELPAKVRNALGETIEMTAENTGMTLALALNYGSRNEILDATARLAREYKAGQIKLTDINEKNFNRSLYTAGVPDPDLLIRTSSEMRISNFLLWQISYSEFYVSRVYWPDFNHNHLKRAILAYAGRQRRYGDIR